MRGSTPSISIAGRVVENPAAVIAAYIRKHHKTVRDYDLLAGTLGDVITPEAIAATRLVSSHMRHTEGDWFIRQGLSAPWNRVPAGARLVDADPLENGGLYDDAVDLYDHFARTAPAGIKRAKISKVLYLMRPGLIPILDSRLVARYEVQAAEVGQRLVVQRPGFGRANRMYWAAIRDDLIAATDTLAEVRTYLATTDPTLALTVERLTDLRLLDMLTWSPTQAPVEPDRDSPMRSVNSIVAR